MSTNINPNIDWLGILSLEAKKLDDYVKVDTDQQWSIFIKKIEKKD